MDIVSLFAVDSLWLSTLADRLAERQRRLLPVGKIGL